MKLKNLIFLLFVGLTNLKAQEQYLVVNPIGHKGQIRDVAISNDKKYLISGGFDKTIKKWDLENGEVAMEYRSKIGKGSEGMVYFIELSPDNKYLASGGWFGADDESENVGDIRIFDYETGKIVQVLKGLASSINGLHFTDDSKYVIAADIYSKICKWDILSGKIVATFNYHKFEDEKYLDEFVVRKNRMMSLDRAGNICLWDVNNSSKPLKIDKKTIPQVNKLGLKDIGLPSNLAISPTLTDYAFSIENFIVLMDEKFKPYFIIENKMKPGFLEFSEDGKRLLTGSAARGTDHHAYVFEKQNNNDWKEIADFNQFDASAICGGFINNNTFITAGGSRNYIYIWSIEKDVNGKQKLLQTLKSNGANAYSVGLSEGTIAFADVWTENFGLSNFNKEFDLFLKNISPYSEKSYKKPITKFEAWEIKWCRVGSGLDGLTAGLEIKKNNVPADTLERDQFNGSRHTAYTFSPNGMIITGGDYGFIEAYGTDGKLYNRFVGHTGLIDGLAVSNDGKRLITSSDDNTIRIWSLDKLGMYDDSKIPMSLKEYIDNEMGAKYPLIKKTVDDKVKALNLENDYNKKSIKAWENIIEKLKQNGLKSLMEDVFEYALDEYRAEFIYPIVSIFMTVDGEWIIWNEQGYFSASKKGAQFVGYYLNQGKDREAKFYPFEQFDLKYNRPDIILQDLGLGSEKIRNFYYKAYLKRLEKMGITESQLTGEIHLPTVLIKNHTLSSDKKKVEIDINAFDEKYNLDRINVFINDVPIYGRNGIKLNDGKNINRKINLELAEGKNKIQISVLNNKGVESLKENLYILSPKQNKKPDLYIITIGTSTYKDSRFNLKYAAKDATDIIETFSKDDVYQNIFHKALLNEQSTKENINQLKEFLKNAKIDDVAMVFIAGHGLLDEKLDYYYATHDIDFNNPAQKGILYSELEELLDGITALKKLLFMDTCHSGEVDKDDVEKNKTKVTVEEDVIFRNVGNGIRKKQGEGLENTSELVKELYTDLRRGTGSTIISSAGGAEYAMESDEWKNGLFTYCLLNGLTNKTADLNKDGEIMLSEIQKFVREEVIRISGGQQKPTSRLENITLDYPVWR